jgi:hypothetical protein
MKKEAGLKAKDQEFKASPSPSGPGKRKQPSYLYGDVKHEPWLSCVSHAHHPDPICVAHTHLL